MNAEQLLLHYHRIADAPDAIARLRRFILGLAVRGKLVPQDPRDEPAGELLKRIAREQKARIDRGEIRRSKPLATIDDAPFNAPPGWAWIPLGETGNIFIGNSINDPTRDQLAKAQKGRPFIATKDVGYGLDKIAYDNGLLVEFSDERFKIARANSVLICAEGGSAGKKIGLADREICFGNKLLANETWSVVSPKFVLYAYMSDFFYAQFSGKMTGVIGGISIGNFLELPFMLPPLPEQRRIVAKLDELMALCDRLEVARTEREATRDRLTAASLARLNGPDPETIQADARFVLDALPALTARPDQIKQLRQTILNLAVRGKLVPQDPRDRPVKKVALNIVVKLRGQLREEIDAPFRLPEQWAWRAVDTLADQVTDGEHATPPRIAEPQIPLVTAKNVRDGFMDFARTDWVSRGTAEKAWGRCRPSVGDLLLVCVGATTGRLTVLREPRDMVLVRSVALIRPNLEAN